MVRQTDGPGQGEQSERIAEHSDELTSNWERTLHDMRAMADDREKQGFETLAIPAGDTTPLSPGTGEDDSWGLSHIIPDNYADDFEDLFEVSAFEETGVYQLTSEGFVFLVTECINYIDDVVIYISGSYDMRYAGALVETALDEEKMYTHVKTLDHTHLGTFEHEDPTAFFPNPDEFYAYDVRQL